MFFSTLRRWVDRNLSSSGQRASVAVVLPPLGFSLPCISILPKLPGALASITFTIIWAAFLIWRGTRLGRADALKRDRSKIRIARTIDD
jgi:hypothetical protein